MEQNVVYLVVFVSGLIIGAVVGALVYRKHAKDAEKALESLRSEYTRLVKYIAVNGGKK